MTPATEHDDTAASLKRLLAEIVEDRDAANAALKRMVDERATLDQWMPEAAMASDPETPLTLVERAVATYTFVYLCLRVLPESALHEIARNMHNAILLYREKEEVAR